MILKVHGNVSEEAIRHMGNHVNAYLSGEAKALILEDGVEVVWNPKAQPKAQARKWYSVNAKSADTTEILILDDIDPYWGIGAKQFIAELDAITTPNIDIRINSYGGSVFDGLAMANAIKRHPSNTRTIVEGIAASIASVIALASDKVVIGDGAFLMIHNAWQFTWGNAKQLRKTADDLDKVNESIIETYQKRTGLERDRIVEMMDEDTWLNAAECLEMGFADESMEGLKAAAMNREFAKAFKNVPAALLAADNEQEQEAAPPVCNNFWRMNLREKRQALIETTTKQEVK